MPAITFYCLLLLLANGAEIVDDHQAELSEAFQRKLQALLACHARSINTIEALYTHNQFLVQSIPGSIAARFARDEPHQNEGNACSSQDSQATESSAESN